MFDTLIFLAFFSVVCLLLFFLFKDWLLGDFNLPDPKSKTAVRRPAPNEPKPLPLRPDVEARAKSYISKLSTILHMVGTIDEEDARPRRWVGTYQLPEYYLEHRNQSYHVTHEIDHSEGRRDRTMMVRNLVYIADYVPSYEAYEITKYEPGEWEQVIDALFKEVVGRK